MFGAEAAGQGAQRGPDRGTSMTIMTRAAGAALIGLAAATLGGCSPARQQAQTDKAAAARPSDADSEATMREAEAEWAALAVKAVPGLLERILADDYIGVSSKGDVRTKAQQIAHEAGGPDGTYRSTKLDYVHYRHFGDTVIAQGGETLTAIAAGTPSKSLIWTDVWMWRGGKWQVVASQDSVLPPAAG